MKWLLSGCIWGAFLFNGYWWRFCNKSCCVQRVSCDTVWRSNSDVIASREWSNSGSWVLSKFIENSRWLRLWVPMSSYIFARSWMSSCDNSAGNTSDRSVRRSSTLCDTMLCCCKYCTIWPLVGFSPLCNMSNTSCVCISYFPLDSSLSLLAFFIEITFPMYRVHIEVNIVTLILLSNIVYVKFFVSK